MAGVLDELRINSIDLVTHDIGNAVGYAFAAQYPKRVTRFVLIDAPLPRIGPGKSRNPLRWHFRFGGPDMERLVARRERIYLDRFWNEFSTTPSRFSAAARTHYAKLYAMPGAMHSGFMQFAAFDRDAKDNQASEDKVRLLRRCWRLAARSRLERLWRIMRFAASDVREGVLPGEDDRPCSGGRQAR